VPLSTVEMQKLASRKLHMGSERTMQVWPSVVADPSGTARIAVAARESWHHYGTTVHAMALVPKSHNPYRREDRCR
jgi:hypothetical protein